MENKLYNEIGYYIRERIDKRVSFKEFLDYSAASVPVNLEEGKSRIVINYINMCGNYLAIFGIFLCLFLVMHPLLIIPIGICLGLLYVVTENNTDTINVLGKSYTKLHIYCVAFGLPILFFIFMPNSLVSLFFTITLAVLLCVGHMVIYRPALSPNEEHI